MRHTIVLLALATAVGLTGCMPAPGLVTEGPYRGCTVTIDGTTIDCPPYEGPAGERRERGADVPPTTQPPPEPDDGPDMIPRPLPPPSCDPICPLPEPEPEPEPEPPVCKPGYGHGDPNACHDGPPGR